MSPTTDSPALFARLGLPLLALALVALLSAGCGGAETNNPPPPDGSEQADDETKEDEDENENGETPKDDVVAVDPGALAEGACRTEVDSAIDAEAWTPLCKLSEGSIQHVRIEGMGVAAGGHQAAQFLLGYDEAPTSAQATTGAGQFLVQMYAGIPKTLFVYYGDSVLMHRGTRDFTAERSTLCFDLVGGSDTRAPAVTLWISGENGADCRDLSTLSSSTAWLAQDTWLDKDDTPVVGALNRDAGAFAYQYEGVVQKPVVTLFPRSVASCETEWSEDTEWQQLCEPAGGATRFRVEGVEASVNNSYLQVVVGEEDAPDGNPTSIAGDGKVVVSAGKSHRGASASFFRFEDNATGQFAYETDDEEALYVDAASTICSEVAANAAGNASVLFWATGAAGADCADGSTLTRDNALYADAWASPLAADKKNFVKVNNAAGIGLGRVIVSNDRVSDSEKAPEGACRTEVASAVEAEAWTPVCELEEGSVQHVRVEGMGVSAGGHQASQFLLGYDEAPTSSRGTTGDGQLIVQMYAGIPNTLFVYYGDSVLMHAGERDFTAGPSTLCFDLVGGSDTRAPAVTLWITGENGADCRDFTTLTSATAWLAQDTWLDGDDNPVVGALKRDAGAFLYQYAGVAATPVVTLFNQGVASCETIWVDNTEWQPLCEPAGGATRFRVEDAVADTNSRYFYVVVGEDDAPENNPATFAGDGKLVVNGGQSHTGASATFFKFEDNSTDQFVFETDDETPLYVEGKSTVCSEIADVDGKASVLFWATGANGADCAAPASLTVSNTLHAQSWDAPLVTGKKNYVKTSKEGVGLARVVVSNDRVAP